MQWKKTKKFSNIDVFGWIFFVSLCVKYIQHTFHMCSLRADIWAASVSCRNDYGNVWKSLQCCSCEPLRCSLWIGKISNLVQPICKRSTDNRRISLYLVDPWYLEKKDTELCKWNKIKANKKQKTHLSSAIALGGYLWRTLCYWSRHRSAQQLWMVCLYPFGHCDAYHCTLSSVRTNDDGSHRRSHQCDWCDCIWPNV